MSSELKDALAEEYSSWAWKWVFRPFVLLQFALYVAATWRFYGRWSAGSGIYRHSGASDPDLHVNHLGNYAIVDVEPNHLLLGIHMGMAVIWVGGLLVQKTVLRRMAEAIDATGEGRTKNSAAYRRYRRVHAVLGTTMCVAGLLGCVAGPIVAWQSHAHAPMQVFLLLLPLYFLPAIATTWITARRKRFHDHQMWADLAFLGPAVASLWAEALIYYFGRGTPLGPRIGELTGVSVAWVVSFALLVLPAYLRRRRAARSSRKASPRR